MVAPTSSPRFSKTRTYSTSLRPPSAALRSAHRSTTSRAPDTPSDQNVASCSGVYRTTSERPSGKVGHRLTNDRTRYGSGDSSPPTQNGHASCGRFGRCWRDATTATVAPLSASSRMSGRIIGRGSRKDQRREALQVLGQPRGAHRDVDLVGARLRVAADRVDDLVVGTGEHPGPDAVDDRAELRAQAVLAERQPDVDRAPDRRRVAPGIVAVAGEHLPLAGQLVGGDERYVPAVGVACRDAQRALLATAADPDRQLALHRLRLAVGVAQREVFALEVHGVLAQQQADAPHGFFEDVEPDAVGRERDAVRLVLVERPAGAETELRATAAQMVDGGDRVGEHGGVPVAGAVDERSAADAARVAGERSVRGDGLQARVAAEVRRVEVVPDRDPVEAE